MALKPTIYKVQVQLSDSDRNCYEDLALTIACHPSETLERMTTRLLAYCRHSAAGLAFTKGLSTNDEPDLWQHSDSGEIKQWIEIGQPEEPRLRKARGRAHTVAVHAFGAKADTWWSLNRSAIEALDGVEVWQWAWPEIQAMAALLGRTTQLSVSIVGGTVYVDNGEQSCSLTPILRKPAAVDQVD